MVALAVGTLALSGCQTESGPRVITDQHLGMRTVVSSKVKIGNSNSGVITAAAMYEKDFGHGVMIFSNASEWQFFKQAWSHGKRYKYVSLGGDVASCNYGCNLAESGFISMSQNDFQNAARTGFEFKLVGKGSANGQVPAKLFQEVLTMK